MTGHVEARGWLGPGYSYREPSQESNNKQLPPHLHTLHASQALPYYSKHQRCPTSTHSGSQAQALPYTIYPMLLPCAPCYCRAPHAIAVCPMLLPCACTLISYACIPRGSAQPSPALTLHAHVQVGVQTLNP